MPKTQNTRQQRAIELFNTAKRGPSSLTTSHELIRAKTPEEMQRRLAENYRIWCDTWILPALLDLVPELRKIKGNF